MTNQPRWGICTTAKAPAKDILRFAAHHLEAGAHRVWIHLDAPNEAAQLALKAHPKCRVALCDDTYWKRLGHRPHKHQVRQTQNATRCYARANDVDWLLHADVDEFLISEQAVEVCLAAQSANVKMLRIRPMEALAPPQQGHMPQAYKTFLPPGPDRQDTVAALYPEFAAYLKGGFLSHVAGKLFLRTGLTDISFRIHNVFQTDQKNPACVEAFAFKLAHLHASDWAGWRAHLDFRLTRGAYRADLAAAHPRGAHLHDLLRDILDRGGEDGLRQFFETVAADTPAHRARLAERGMLHLQDLDFEAVRLKHFPNSG